ncbi:MAG: caspase family protein [bacterium]|nr:caspase family protein [bacterium]
MAANRHSLLIGINEYPNLQGGTLQGCKNDVALIGSLLIDRFGFPEENCIVLLNREATQSAIRSAFDEILRRVGDDDVVVCFYAGHGSRTADPRRDGAMIESIVPSDSGRGTKANRDVYDVEIDRWVQRLNAKTPYVTLIFDCCHSGSVTRDPFGEAEVRGDERADLSGPARGLRIRRLGAALVL